MALGTERYVRSSESSILSWVVVVLDFLFPLVCCPQGPVKAFLVYLRIPCFLSPWFFSFSVYSQSIPSSHFIHKDLEDVDGFFGGEGFRDSKVWK